MSLRSDTIRMWSRLAGADRRLAKCLLDPPRGTDMLNIEKFSRKVRVKRWSVAGCPGVTINGSYPGQGHVLFLPGGGYTLEPLEGHRRIAERFALQEHLKVSVFCYPLAPEHTAEEACGALLPAWNKLLREYPGDDFFLLGDFSGGGLGLAFLQALRQSGNLPMPKRTALVSPWLDLSLSNPRIKLAKRTDSILPVEELIEVGNRYRGALAPDHPLVSPLFGPLEGLGPILVFAGTEEILAPDCELLAEKAEKAQGTEVVLKMAAKMFHDWITLPCPETDAALDLIAGFFLEEEGERAVVVEEQKGLRKTVEGTKGR